LTLLIIELANDLVSVTPVNLPMKFRYIDEYHSIHLNRQFTETN